MNLPLEGFDEFAIINRFYLGKSLQGDHSNVTKNVTLLRKRGLDAILNKDNKRL